MSEFEKLKIVTRYEFLKHLRRKRLYLILGIIIAVELSVLVGLPVLGQSYPDDVTAMAGMLSIGSVLVTIGAVFFAGDAIAGEFEEKTGYILLPNPVKRTTMVIGKYLACYAAIAMLAIIGYAIACASLLVIYGQVPVEACGSFALTILFAGSILSLTFFFSSISKGAMGATVMTLAFLMIISGVIDGVLTMAGHNAWFLLSRAGDVTLMVYPGFKAAAAGMVGAMGMPGGATEYNIDLCIIAMVAYLVVCFLLSIWITKRREML